YYTQMTEIEQQTDRFDEKIDVVFLQAGVGSWPSAVIHFVRNHPALEHTKIVCVEPYESDCFLESVKNGKRSATKKNQKTIMAGLNCGTPSLLAWEIMKNNTDCFLSVSDSYTIKAMKEFSNPHGGDPRIEAGESGAAGLAGLIAVTTEPGLNDLRKQLGLDRNATVLLFNTEGITDPEFFRKNIHM
ncbi:MAG: pyridoxal-phosphate dependent enzyme, partial [Bacteroidales bacterium]